jgi:hypothetical protein
MGTILRPHPESAIDNAVYFAYVNDCTQWWRIKLLVWSRYFLFLPDCSKTSVMRAIAEAIVARPRIERHFQLLGLAVANLIPEPLEATP